MGYSRVITAYAHELLMSNNCAHAHELLKSNTVEPRSTDTPLIRTPRYYGQFGIPRPKDHTFL